ncbi:MAG TPA: phosphoglycerate kinase [Paracoccaceae bacterium]|nr:phosphoglycerate kinase [Paracoccaceae bacterium]
MTWRTLDDLDLDGRVALIRVDLNVPVQDGRVADPTRIEAVAPTVRDVLAAGGRPVLLSHFGRPKGRRVPEMSLSVVREALAETLGHAVAFAEDCVGEKAEAAVDALEPGEVLLLENTRFHSGEEANDPQFAHGLAALGDVYVNDAFSAAHRAHASTEGLAHLLPAAAGRRMQAELEALNRALTDPERPVVAVVGGAKVSTKLDLLSNLIERVDVLIVGGGMANTFLAAQGRDVGASLHEKDLAETARGVMAKARATGCEILLPVDAVVAKSFEAHAPAQIVDVDHVPHDAMILDAGPKSVVEIERRFETARTLVWNGPLGAFELEPFDAATNAAAAKAAALTRAGRLTSVAGGGDTVSALNRAGAADGFTYVSAAGGAFLEWLEGRTLPGVAALERAKGG